VDAIATAGVVVPIGSFFVLYPMSKIGRAGREALTIRGAARLEHD
jgi:hypothetical protein